MFGNIAIIAPGAMGSAIAARFAEHGKRVLTMLEGRSAATIKRAGEAGMVSVPAERIVEADLILSIVPPAEAVALAGFFAPLLASSPHKPVFADCNALDVATVRKVGEIISATGTPFADAAIIGTPPVKGQAGPVLYVSGAPAPQFADLGELGLRLKVMEAPVGAASALKMSYSGINKGLVGIAAAMIQAASRAGAETALREELKASRPQIYSLIEKAMPEMYPKAYRWVAEMREISAFVSEDEAAASLYEAMAEIYAGIAADRQSEGQAIARINAFLERPDAPKA